MKLYNKHLTSVADLKREKYLMRYAKQVHGAEDLLSFNGGSGGEKKGKRKKKEMAVETDGGNPLGMISSLLGGGGAASTLLGNRQVRKFIMSRIPRKTIGSIAWEIASGYLKWKAIELSYGFIAGMVKKRREKKRAERFAQAYDTVARSSRRK